ncbi:DUF4113 domain-containing protein [Pseudomonas moorei]
MSVLDQINRRWDGAHCTRPALLNPEWAMRRELMCQS